MLVLTRRVGESVVLDGGIRVTVVQADPGMVRLGVEAPPSVGIFRAEVLDRVARENLRACVPPEAVPGLRSGFPTIPTSRRVDAPGGREPQP